MKKSFIILLFLSITLTSHASQNRCDQLNKSLPGKQEVRLLGGESEIKFIYEIEKVEDYVFEVVTTDMRGYVLNEKVEMRLEVRNDGRCYFYNTNIEDRNNDMKISGIHLTPFTFGYKILEAEFINNEGFAMFMKEAW